MIILRVELQYFITNFDFTVMHIARSQHIFAQTSLRNRDEIRQNFKVLIKRLEAVNIWKITWSTSRKTVSSTFQASL
jgi:hypothetical protein